MMGFFLLTFATGVVFVCAVKALGRILLHWHKKGLSRVSDNL